MWPYSATQRSDLLHLYVIWPMMARCLASWPPPSSSVAFRWFSPKLPPMPNLLSGRLQVDVGFERYQLGPGDSISFPATTPHRLANDGPEPARAIWCILGRHRGVQ